MGLRREGEGVENDPLTWRGSGWLEKREKEREKEGEGGWFETL